MLSCHTTEIARIVSCSPTDGKAAEFLGNQTARHADTRSEFRAVEASRSESEKHVIANDLLKREANVFNAFNICSHA